VKYKICPKKKNKRTLNYKNINQKYVKCDGKKQKTNKQTNKQTNKKRRNKNKQTNQSINRFYLVLY